MARLFEEIDSQDSPLGEISLRKRVIPALGLEPIYEVKLGDEFLMSSLFVAAEEALATLGLAASKGEQLSVVVGGLGLGFTAVAALTEPRISELLVVEALPQVIGWHQDEKVPLGAILNNDSRCRYVEGSFFDLAASGFDRQQPGRLFDAILLDIDHSPTEFLNAGNAGFYTTENLQQMARQLTASGVFAMWSQDLPDDDFMTLLGTVFSQVKAEVVKFYNPFRQSEETNSVYIALR
ncbi:MAG TPA: spermidine synthase [Cellvibrionaceae bacterium]